MSTIQKRNNGYFISVSCGYDVNGKQIRRTMTYKPEPNMTAKQIEKEVQRQAVLFEEKCKSGNNLDSNIKFAAFAELWFADRKKDLRPKTYARYLSMLPRINAAIGHLRLDRIQPLHLRQFYDNLSEGGIRQDTKYKCNIDVSKYLKDNKLSGAKLSRQSGLSTSTVTALKKGNNVTYESAVKLSEYMNQPLDTLFTSVGSGKPLAPKTVLHHHRLISSILSTAVEWGVLFSNPCERTKPPKVENKDPKYLDEVQAAALLDLLESEDTQNKMMIRLLLFTGLRRGELLGLEWQDINFDNNTVQIRRSSQYLPDRGIYEDGVKNDTSDRVMKISPSAVEDLKIWRVWQREHAFEMGDRWHSSDRLFTTDEGLPLHPDVLTSWFTDFVKAHSDVLPPITIHSLRHTNATLQIAAGVPLTTVAKRLGHANTVTTSKIYAHAIKSADEAAAETLDNLLTPGKNKKAG